MIVVDANLLIYAYSERSSLHREAKRWLERAFSGPEAVGLPWSSIHAFLRIITRPPLLDLPLSMEQAAKAVHQWLEQPTVAIINPRERYWTILQKLMIHSQIRGDLVMDAHLAALTIENAGTLHTTDKDFTRFEDLRVVNPLQKS